MLNCNIKESATVFNYAKEKFFDAFMLSKGKADTAFDFALSETQKKFPDFNIDAHSFINPMSDILKKEGFVKEDYQYGKKKKSKVTFSEKLPEKKQPKEKSSFHDPISKIEKIVSKFSGLNQEQKKKLATNLFEKLNKDGLLNEDQIKNIYAEVLGLPAMTPELQKQMDAVTADMEAHEKVLSDIDDLNANISKAIEEKPLTPEQHKLFQEQADLLKQQYKSTLAATVKSNQEFSNALATKRFWVNTYADMMLMNLMSVPALVKNLTGAVADALLRQMSNAVSTPIMSMILRKNLIGSRYKGGYKSTAMKKAKITWMTGSEAKFSRGLVPPNYLNSIREFRNLTDKHGFEKVIKGVWGFLKLHPDFVSRALQSTDAGVYSLIEASELYRIGKEKGLSGAQLDLFVLKPDQKSAEIAAKKASSGTFKQNVGGIDTFFRKITGEQLEKSLVAKNWDPRLAKYAGGLASVAKALVFPFVKTPINMIRIAGKLVLPEAVLIHGLNKARKETDRSTQYKIVAETLATATIGFHLRIVAMNMVAMGLISGGYDDEDEKTKEAVETELGGPNRINISAFFRGLFLRDMKKKSGDTILDLSSMGAVGIALGSYAHAYGKRGKKDIEEQIKYTQNWNALTVPLQSTFHLVGGALDNTFFSGINQLNKTIKDVQNGTGNTGEKYFANSLATFLGGIGNGTYQKLSKANTPERKLSYDKDKTFGENLKTILGYRFAFGGQDAKNKYYLLSKDIESATQRKPALFDNYLGRALSEMSPFHFTSESEGTPINILFDESRNVPKEDRSKLFPTKVPDKITTKKGVVELNDAQYKFLEEQTSVFRMLYAKPFIESEEFKKESFEDKTGTLTNLYSDALKEAQKTTIENFGLTGGKKKGNKRVKELTKKFRQK